MTRWGGCLRQRALAILGEARVSASCLNVEMPLVEDEELIAYLPMRAGEEPAVATLITRVFDQYVAPAYGAEGVR